MKKIRIILEGNSKNVDIMSSQIVKIVRESGEVKSGPVCFKNKKLIDVYINHSTKCINRLTLVKPLKGVDIEITILE